MPPVFFCQVEALETAIFLAEVAGHRQPWIENKLREDSQARNPGLYRIAFKMATGSGYREGTLFPWVVSDFSLIDAIEAGIVKIPRVPVSDDSVAGASPTYRDLWAKIRDALPRKSRATDEIQGEPRLPKELEGALRSLYGNYEKSYVAWRASGAGTPPVFIVACQNTNISKLVFVRIADGGAEPLHLIIEVTGEHRREKAAKVATAETYWVPAVNNLGGLGRWSFLEVSDPWDAANLIRAHVRTVSPVGQ